MMSDLNKTRGLGGEGGDNKENNLDSDSIKTSKSILESNQVPNELLEVFEEFKRFLKQQKLIKEENSEQRFNVEPIITIDEQIVYDINNLEINLQNKSKQIDILKKETSELVNYGEIAYRSIKSELQSSNVYINKYLQSKLNSFEQMMLTYSKQIKLLENHLKNLNKFSFTPDELFDIMRKQHETLIALAENVYLIHEKVNLLKIKGESFNFGKAMEINVYEDIRSSNVKSFVGPNPFSRNAFLEESFQSPTQQQQPQTYSAPSQTFNLFQTNPNTSTQSFGFSSPFDQQSSKVKRWV